MKSAVAVWRRITRYRASLAVYFLVGGSAALVEWTVFYLLLRFANIGYLAAAVCGFAVATLVNYGLSRRYAFLSKGVPAGGEIARTYLVSAFGLSVNLGSMTLLVELAGLHPLPAKIFGTGCGFLINFTGRQFWVFRSAPRY